MNHEPLVPIVPFKAPVTFIVLLLMTLFTNAAITGQKILAEGILGRQTTYQPVSMASQRTGQYLTQMAVHYHRSQVMDTSVKSISANPIHKSLSCWTRQYMHKRSTEVAP